MIEAWAMQRSVRLFLTGGILIAGFVLAALFIQQRSLTIATAIFSVGLAALVGAGKLASP